jgi:hypothetical protein
MSHEMSPSQLGQQQTARTPGWALDEGWKRPWRGPTGEERHVLRIVGYAVSIAVNLILIVIARSIPSWELPFLTAAFGEVLPAIERSLVVAIVANAVLCAYDAPWFRHLARVVMNAFALNAMLALARVFPFEFSSSTGNDAARLTLLLVTIAIIIAIFVEAVKMLLSLLRGNQESDG